MQKRPISNKFEVKARPFEVGDICKIESERNIRHKGQPLNGRYGKILEIKTSPDGQISVHFELQPTSQKIDRSYDAAREANRRFQEYGGRRGYTPRIVEKIWIAASALKYVRSEEDEVLAKRLKEARAHNAPKTDWRGNPVQPKGTYDLATGQIVDQGNYAVREALGRALGLDKK